MFAELANSYYRDEGRKIKTRIEKKSISSIELHVRYCFKVIEYWIVLEAISFDWCELFAQ